MTGPERERYLCRRREYYKKNKARITAQQVAYRKRKLEQARAAARRRYAANPQKYKDIIKRCQTSSSIARKYSQQRQWWKENPERAADYRHKRRLLKAAHADLSKKQWLDLVASFGSKCAYCGQQTKLGQEHLVPLSRGGSHTLENVVPACQPCNSKKCDRTPLEFFMGLSRLRNRN